MTWINKKTINSLKINKKFILFFSSFLICSRKSGSYFLNDMNTLSLCLMGHHLYLYFHPSHPQPIITFLHPSFIIVVMPSWPSKSNINILSFSLSSIINYNSKYSIISSLANHISIISHPVDTLTTLITITTIREAKMMRQ